MKTKKRFSKLTAWLLTLAMLMTFMPGFTLSASADEIENIYKQMLEHIKPENKYGLGDIPESRIFHAWGWSYQNIKARLEAIAEQGFSTILVSPPNEIKMPTEGIKFHEPETNGISPNGWWMLYQPAGFQLNESWDNALGTKSEFIELCEIAHALGLKIMVEAVVGYAGTDDDYAGEYDNVSTDPMAHVTPRMAEFEPELWTARAFHDPWVNCTYKNNYWDGWSDYDIEESLTQHAIDAKPDLATEEQIVQDVIYDYFVELVEAGADGFYFNDAKYIETSYDTFFPSDFWEDTLGKIREQYPDKNLQAIAEIINGSGDGRSAEEYLQYGMNLTHTAMSDDIRNSVINGTDISAAFDDALPQENSVLWGESYKSYANGETSSLTSEQRAKIWALTVSRKGVKGIYLGRPSDTLAEGKDEVNNILSTITLGEANVTDWTTEVVKRVNHFAGFFENADENVHYDNGFAVIERDGVGAVLVNMQGKDAAVFLSENTLADGEYTDAITGNKFTVGNGIISGEIGESGIAVLYQVKNVAFYNIYVGGKQFTSENLTITDDNGGTATYDPATNTLTLDNYTYTGDGYEKKAILYSGAQGNTLNINLVGESCVTLTNDIGQGLDAWSSITFSGSGSLDITGGPHGVNVMGTLTVNDGSITATGDSYGVNVMDVLTINSGSLTTTGGSFGVNAMGDITVLSGSLSATGDNYGVNAMGSITLSGGTIVAQGETYAINKTPTVDSDFTDATVWYGASASEANEKGGKLYKDVLDNPDTSMEIITAKYVRIAGNTYTITFNPNGGSVEPATMTALGGKLESLPAPTRSGYNFNGWFDAETGGNKITTDTVFTEDTTVYAQWTKRSSGGGGSSTTTTTTKNEDGSTTKVTENKATGTKIEVTTNPDGSTSTVETKKDGTVTTTEKDKDGNTTTTVEKPDGTSTTTEKNKDGSEKVTEEKADGTTVTTEKDTDGTKTVTTENADGSTTTEETKKDGTKVTTETNADGETTAEVEAKGETEVVIPAPNAEEVTKVVVTDKDGNETEVEFEVKDGGVAISVSGNCTAVVNKAAKKVFDDIHPVNHWAIADVDYVFAKGLMNGVSETHFAPNEKLTRAMLVTVLYRLEGEPRVSGITSFADLEQGQYYLDAVCWAQLNGIVNGVSETEFAPNDNITREQIAAIFYRYAIYKGMDAVNLSENLDFTDADKISEYAISALNWAAQTGLIKGYEDNTVRPLNNATRAEAAALLQRFIEVNK